MKVQKFISYLIIISLSMQAIETKVSTFKLLQNSPSINYTFLLQTKYPSRKVIHIDIEISYKTKEINKAINNYTFLMSKLQNLTLKYNLDYYHQATNSFVPLQMTSTSNYSQIQANSLHIQSINLKEYEFYTSLVLQLRQTHLFLSFMEDLFDFKQFHKFQVVLAYEEEIIDKSQVTEKQLKEYIIAQSEKKCHKYFNMQLSNVVGYQNINDIIQRKIEEQKVNEKKQMQEDILMMIKKQKNKKNKKPKQNDKQQQKNKQLKQQFETYSYYEALQKIQEDKIDELVQKYQNDLFMVQVICKNNQQKVNNNQNKINGVLNQIQKNKNKNKKSTQINSQQKQKSNNNKTNMSQKIKEIVVNNNRSQIINIQQKIKQKQVKKKGNKIDLKVINQNLKNKNKKQQIDPKGKAQKQKNKKQRIEQL